MWKKRIVAVTLAAAALMPGVSNATPPPPPPPSPETVPPEPVWPVIEALYGVMTETCRTIVGPVCRLPRGS